MWNCESEGGTLYSIEVHGNWTSKLVRSYFWGEGSLICHCDLPHLLGRKKILDSKSYKQLQELNLALDKQAAELDSERVTLAKTLQDYSGGKILEQALLEVHMELAALEAQDFALRQQIIRETEKLCQLEEKVGNILHY